MSIRQRHRSAPLHACCRSAAAGRCMRTALARELGIRRIVVPRIPACCRRRACWRRRSSTRRRARSARRSHGLDWPEVARSARASSTQRCAALMRSEGVPAARDRSRRYFADVCYVGQAYHLEVRVRPMARPIRSTTLDRRLLAAHDRSLRPQHAQRRSRSSTCARSISAQRQPATAGREPGAGRATRIKGTRRILLAGRWRVRRGRGLRSRRAGARRSDFDGPAIVEQADTTTVVEPGWRATCRRATAALDASNADGKERA